jgi:arylsulfatase A-like enzyme
MNPIYLHRFFGSLLPVALLLALSDIVFGTEPARPNIVLFLVDDMGVMDTSVPFLTDAQGAPKRHPLNAFYRTPNMERLAALGTRFSRFYAMSVCSPTRVALMTGQNSARHRVTTWIQPNANNKGKNGPPDWNWSGLNAASMTLPRLLQGNGYRTIHIGKGHFGPHNSAGADPRNLGFDVNVGGAAFGQPGSYLGRKNYGGYNKAANNNAVPGLDAYHGTETFLTDALTAEAIKHVTAAVKDDKSFFLYLPHYAVHAPFDEDPRFTKNYEKEGVKPAARNFAALIEGMDHSLGTLLDQLERLGVAENTLVFFLGDNGSDAPLGPEHTVACAAPLRGKKGTHYEGGMRVPFIAAWAKRSENPLNQRALPIVPGAIQQRPAAVYDLFPTILAVTGTPMPKEQTVDGQPLAPLLTNRSDQSGVFEFLMHFPHQHRSSYFTVLENERWKAVYHTFPSAASQGARYELFDLANDPFESTNLAEKEPTKLREMMLRMTAKLAEQQAQYPVDDNGAPLKPLIP